MTEHAGVVRVRTYVSDPGRRDQLLEALHRISEEARGADGCFGAQVCSVEDRPDAVAVVSRWRSRGDMDAYLAEHIEQINQAVNALVTAEPVTVHLTSVSR